MPQTVPDGFEFEVTGDTPGRTLDGAGGTSSILAEQVQAKFVTVDADVAALQTAVGLGWVPIGFAEETGNFTIDLTAGGAFPAGTFRMIRIFFRGAISTDDTNLNCRVNGDSTAGLHERGAITRQLSDGSVVTSFASAATSWPLGRFSTFAANNAEITVFDTHLNTTISFMSRGHRASSVATAMQIQEGGGRLAANRLLSTLTVFPTSGSVSSIRWIAEGWRAP
jgi:hypothetical protein